MTRLILPLIVIHFLLACSKPNPKKSPGFIRIDNQDSGIDFSNDLTYTSRLNTYTFRNFYNGAGVALGDINNDGLPDIYFSGNQVDNKLYLNLGNFHFQDITVKAGVNCPNTWSTGVSMADVNSDGWLDIFVCKSGPPLGGIRHNQLFINNGDLTFTDKSVEWGVADSGLSLHAAFLDYDKDGDQDFYLLNNSNRSVGAYDLREGQREINDPFGGNKFYRNDGNKFTDVSTEVGIFTSAIGFGLGVAVADINKDGWQDLFVSNDFFERDYLYINRKNGTFQESLSEYMNEISMGSMGADIADINNDGYPEIFVTEMLPERLERKKTKISFESYDKYISNQKSGYHRQFSRNVLYLNRGPHPLDSQQVFFHEIGRYAGVAATDWSWGSLIFDYDNDGFKDIFVANGIAKDLLDQDYVNFKAPSITQSSGFGKDSTDIIDLINAMPSEPIDNYLFKNTHNLKFNNTTSLEGLNIPSFSNGAVYGDLNNDGALDLIISNINQQAFIYKNVNPLGNNFLHFDLRYQQNKVIAVGSQVTIYSKGNIFYTELSASRGYLSSTDPRVHIGLGRVNRVDSIEIKWPNGLCTYLYDQPVNKNIQLVQSSENCQVCFEKSNIEEPLFKSIDIGLESKIIHQSGFIDFNRDRLVMEAYSNRGTAIAQGDINSDGHMDIFLGGAAGNPGELWFYDSRTNRYKMLLLTKEVLDSDAAFEDSDAIIHDFNQDGYQDLFVASGSNIFSEGSFQLLNRLYLNNGKGELVKKENFVLGGSEGIPTNFVKSFDFNLDGFTDLLLGHSFRPFNYGYSGSLEILAGSKDGFINVTKQYGPFFKEVGMVTDAVIIDYDNDSDLDIILCGHWMGLRLIENINGTFTKDVPLPGTESFSGIYNALETADFNNDGFIDLVAGNAGTNRLYDPDIQNPWFLYVGDLDGNSNDEQLLCISIDGKQYPVNQYLDLAKQIPIIRKRTSGFNAYQGKSVNELIESKLLLNAKKLKVTDLSSAVFLNNKDRMFSKINLPADAQLTSIYALLINDFNEDGINDLILGGNEMIAKPEWGIQTASNSIALKGHGDGSFETVSPYIAGLFVDGEIRRIIEQKHQAQSDILFLINNQPIKTYKLNR